MDTTGQPTPALHYDGRLGDLYRIFLVNILLTAVTLGIYGFWAITRFRQYLWSRMAHGGQRFAYAGTGGELFLGALLAFGAVAGMLAVTIGLVWLLPAGWALLPLALFYAAVAVLAAGAAFAAQRYRLSRTAWAGVRGGMDGAAWRHGLRVIGYGLLQLLTLLQLTPWAQMRLAEARINASRFGATPFRFEGRARRLYLPFLLTLLGVAFVVAAAGAGAARNIVELARLADGGASLPGGADLPRLIGRVYGSVLVIVVLAYAIGSFYRALVARHILGGTTLGPLRFASSVSGWRLMGLGLGNALILLLTLGLGYPVVLHRNARFLARTTWAQGVLDPASLGTAPGRGPRVGEGMYQVLDAGGIT